MVPKARKMAEIYPLTNQKLIFWYRMKTSMNQNTAIVFEIVFCRDFMWPDVLLPFQSNHLKSGPIISVIVSFQTSRDLQKSSNRWKVESIKCVLPEVEQSGWFSFYEFIFTQCISSVGKHKSKKHKLPFYHRLIVIVLVASRKTPNL